MALALDERTFVIFPQEQVDALVARSTGVLNLVPQLGVQLPQLMLEHNAFERHPVFFEGLIIVMESLPVEPGFTVEGVTTFHNC